MKLKILKLIGALAMCVFTLSMINGCEHDCNDDIKSGNDDIAFALLDKNTGQYLFKESNENYHIDTFKIFDQNQIQLGEYNYDYFRDGSYGYRFNIIDVYDYRNDPNAQNQEVCKQYYLYLNYTDTDTLEICFMAERDKCLYFKQFRAFYNDTLVFTDYTQDVSYVFEVLKN